MRLAVKMNGNVSQPIGRERAVPRGWHSDSKPSVTTKTGCSEELNSMLIHWLRGAIGTSCKAIFIVHLHTELKKLSYYNGSGSGIVA